MPIIAVEEDDEVDVSRLLFVPEEVQTPANAVTPTRTRNLVGYHCLLSNEIEPIRKAGGLVPLVAHTGSFNEKMLAYNLGKTISTAPIVSSSAGVAVEEDDDDDDNDNDSNKECDDVFELVSLASNQSDQLNISIGNSTSPCGGPASLFLVDQMNVSISNSTSSRRRNSYSKRRSNSITAVEEEYDNNDDADSMNTFELCSIPSATDILAEGITVDNSTSSSRRNSSIKQRSSSITAEEEDYDDNDDADYMNTFELCSIPSATNLAELYDPLNISLNISIGNRSIENSTSSKQRNKMSRKESYSEQSNRSASSSVSSSSASRNRVFGKRNNNMKRSTSIGSKLFEVVDVVPKKDVAIDTKYLIDYSCEIGQGTKTIVRKCTERSSRNQYAVKSVKRIDKIEYEHMRTEANLLTSLTHPSIIKIIDSYEDDKYLHMVVEICNGGELYDQVVKINNRSEIRQSSFSEEVVAVIVHRVVDAVAYLHEHNIVHRDLKLENILFKSKADDNNKDKYNFTDIRVIDFGLSRRYNTHHRVGSLKKLTSFVGSTKFYVAPEILNHSYTHAADVWSIGILAYELLLSATSPFSGRRTDQELLFDKIQACCDVKFPSPDFDDISDDAKDFIRCLLMKDEDSRPTASELLDSPWMIKAARWKEGFDETHTNSKPSVFKVLFSCFGRKRKD